MLWKKLKGGSLSSTYAFHDGSFVRKEVDLKNNREYGFVRWSSQLKKIQRYSALAPDLFPKLLEVGVIGETAFFDMQFLEGFKDVKTLFTDQNLPQSFISKVHAALWLAFDRIHYNKIASVPGSLKLYFKEEVEEKLREANKFPSFSKFSSQETFIFNGNEVQTLDVWLPKLKEYLCSVELESEELILGNPTLENVMYSPLEDRIVFIDLYEESIADTKLLDYAQILQCSNSLYGYINDRQVKIVDNVVRCLSNYPPSFALFNEMFIEELRNRGLDTKLIRVLEATQFIRMLPFKLLAADNDHAQFFYVQACKLLQDIFKNE